MTGPADKTLHSHQDNFEDGETKCEKKFTKGPCVIHVQTLHRNAIKHCHLVRKGPPFMNNNTKPLW